MVKFAGAKAGLGKRGRSSSSKWAEESRKAARESGELPHEFLLRVARGEPIDCYETAEDGTVVEKTVFPSFEDRVEAANICANYYAPKLTAQQVESVDSATEMSDEDLERELAKLEESDAKS